MKKKKVILFIDTSSNEKTSIAIEIDGTKHEKNKTLSKASQNLLILIHEVLEECRVDYKDITEIAANEGPGSYTGLRVGFAVANTLSYVLQIPLNGKKVGEITTPIYPNTY